MDWKAIEEAGYQKRLSRATYKRRNDPDYCNWRNKVLQRDFYSCILCGATENIEVHHLQRWIDAPLQKFKVSNGCVLCRQCHKKGHKNKGKDFDSSLTLKILYQIKDKYVSRLVNLKKEDIPSNVIRRLNSQRAEIGSLINLISKKGFTPKIIVRKHKEAEPDEVGSRASAA